MSDEQNPESPLNWDKNRMEKAAFLVKSPEYEEMPVDIQTFINSPDYMNASNECWEPIKEELSRLFVGYDDPQMNWQYTEAVFDEGIGAGKSYKSSIIITYLLYRTLIFKDPQKFLSLAKGSAIYFLNMSVRGDQAKKVVFGEINQRIKNSPWFTSRRYLANPNVKSELQFPKNITIMPGNSKETFPLGLNLLGGVMDEAAWYTETETHDVAEEMFNALHNRIKNRFGEKGMLVMISSPRYVDDFIEKKMEEAKRNNRIFTVRKTSWDSKPKHMFSGEFIVVDGYSVPIEYKVEAERNWERFKRDYMAIPSLALEPYFKQWELVEACIDCNRRHPLNKDGTFSEWFKPIKDKLYYMHIDLSLTTDATGIAMCHREENGMIVDLMMKIRAEKGKEIDLAGIRAIVYVLKTRGFQIQKCTFDQFQSASSIQEFNKMGLNSERLSIDKDLSCYETLKESINTGRIGFYHSEDFLGELRRLELIKGKKVEHPANGSKDLTDAVAGAVFNCVSGQNMFSFGFAGGNRLKSPQEQLQEDVTRTADGRVTYGYFKGRRIDTGY